MAVTKETYTATATWTASGLATLFNDAFIDAGLMTAWYDSFLSGTIENRILEITYNGAKTYGKAYYWFMFTTTSVHFSIATGWNASTHVPTGTQYLDYYSTTTNATTNHINLFSTLSTGTNAVLERYTSAANTAYTWFSFRNGADPYGFFIAPASTGIATWIDLDKVMFHHFVKSVPAVLSPTSVSYALMEFSSQYRIRRSFWGAGALRGRTTLSSFATTLSLKNYVGTGNTSNSSGNDGTFGQEVIYAPYGFNNTNPAYSTDYKPIINGYSYSSYITSNMPSDFGIFFNYGTTAFSFGDKIIVSAGVEEWEVIDFANNTLTDSPSSLLVNRVV